jgi:integrase
MGRNESGVKKASESSIAITFYYKGERCYERIKLKPTAANLKRVERHKASILEGIENGTFDYAVTFPNSKQVAKFAIYKGVGLTVESYLIDWLEQKRIALKVSTYVGYKKIIDNKIIPTFGQTKLSHLTRQDIKRWCNSMETAVKTINNVISPLRVALQDAADDAVIGVNPLYNWHYKRNEPPRARHDQIDPFSTDEITAILAALSGQDRNLIQFAFETGLRTSELVALEWRDIDFIKQTVHIWKARTEKAIDAEPPKTPAGTRTIPLSDSAFAAVARQKEHTFLADKEIFNNPRSAQRWSGDQQIRKCLWHPALKKAGVRYRYPYQCRHTFASTRLMEATTLGQIMFISKCMGHRDWAFTAKTYTRFIADNFKSTDAGSIPNTGI